VDPHGIGVRGRRAEAVLLAAVFFALLFGFAEVAVLAVQRHVMGRFIWTPGSFAWMTPLGYLMFFVPVAGVVSLIALIRPRWVTTSTMTIAFTILGTLGLLSMIRRIHPLALALLALGIAAMVARGTRSHPAVWNRIRVRATLGLSALWLVILGFDLIGRTTRAAQAVDSTDPAAPNILLIVWDTVRASSLSLYGYGRETTPFLKRLASGGVVFDRAIATAPWTLPSHASLFTGRNAHELDAGWMTPLGPQYPTIAEVLRDHGYRTAAFTANWAYTDREKGLARGFETYADHRITPAQVMLSSALGQTVYRVVGALLSATGLTDFVRQIEYVHPFPGRTAYRRVATEINSEFLSWLDEESTAPFFAFLNFMDAHEPYHAPDEHLSRFESANPLTDVYDSSIAYLDDALERLLVELDRTGQLDRTVVVVTSDHGELLGEHDLVGHGNSLYLPLLNVPLLLVAPGRVPAGIRIRDPVSLRHLPITLLETAGVTATGFPGQPLSRLWLTGPAPDAAPILAEVRKGLNTPAHEPATAGDIWSLTTPRYHYIVHEIGRVELFDHVEDPGELNNLARGGLPDSLAEALRLPGDTVSGAGHLDPRPLLATPDPPR